MAYVVVRPSAAKAKPRAAMPGDCGEHHETIVTCEPKNKTIDTGIVDASGCQTHRVVMDQMGFVRLEKI